jgi:phospholipid/cholesterol/gamma-HCH transport system permease protein
MSTTEPDPGRETTSTTKVSFHDGTLRVTLAGEWALTGASPNFALLVGAAIALPESSPAPPEVRAVDFDATELGHWDSSLLAFLLQVVRYSEAHHFEVRDGTLPAEIAALLGLARAVPEKESRREPRQASRLARLGSRGLSTWKALVDTVVFVGEITDSLVRLILGRFRLRWRDFWMTVESTSVGALPIVTLIAFMVGMIIAFLGAVVLRRFGAGYFVSYLVGYGILREMGALMTGIIMAGRTGAAFASELGSMKITEEIDAYRTLGISPVDHLVLPRVLGLVVTMPLLTVYAGFVGILGGMVVSITMLDLSVTQFTGGLLQALTLSDALLGVFKGTVFGLIIGLSGCLKGMQTGTAARAVGRAATSAVVLGITLIVASNAVIDWLAILLDV